MTRRFAVVAAICGAVAAALVMAGSAFAAFPGANGRIAWTHDTGAPDSTPDIFAADPNGQNRVQLTSGADDDDFPAYSADGEKIAFARYPATGTGDGQIWVMNQDGTGQTQLTQGTPTADDAAPAFSPDGSRIVFDRLRRHGPSSLDHERRRDRPNAADHARAGR